MSRPKLTSLSDLMPPKGEATRPEPISEHPGKLASKQAQKHDGDIQSIHARLQIKTHDREPASEAARHHIGQNHPSEYRDGPRSAVSFRMTERLQDRLREYAHKARRKKQDILDQAVHELLQREGF